CSRALSALSTAVARADSPPWLRPHRVTHSGFTDYNREEAIRPSGAGGSANGGCVRFGHSDSLLHCMWVPVAATHHRHPPSDLWGAFARQMTAVLGGGHPMCAGVFGV